MRKILFSLLALVMVGCGQNSSAQAPAIAPTTATISAPTTAAAPTSAPAPTGNAVSIPTQSQPLVALAHNDLANYLGIPPNQIVTVGVQSMEWSDGSLGCPKSGMMYPQVITAGYKITLEAQGKQYNYHTNTTRRVVRCENA